MKILDFGIAKLVESDGHGLDQLTTAPGTAIGVVVGTVAYMSPEQVAGRAVDQRSDLFSFGVVLYEMLTDRRPFSGNSPIETMTAVLHADPAPLASSDRSVPAALARIVTRCLEKARHRLACALVAALGSTAIHPGRQARRHRRHRPKPDTFSGWQVAGVPVEHRRTSERVGPVPERWRAHQPHGRRARTLRELAGRGWRFGHLS